MSCLQVNSSAGRREISRKIWEKITCYYLKKANTNCENHAVNQAIESE